MGIVSQTLETLGGRESGINWESGTNRHPWGDEIAGYSKWELEHGTQPHRVSDFSEDINPVTTDSLSRRAPSTSIQARFGFRPDLDCVA